MTTFTENLLEKQIAEREAVQRNLEALDCYIAYLRGRVKVDDEIARIAKLDGDAA